LAIVSACVRGRGNTYETEKDDPGHEHEHSEDGGDEARGRLRFGTEGVLDLGERVEGGFIWVPWGRL